MSDREQYSEEESEDSEEESEDQSSPPPPTVARTGKSAMFAARKEWAGILASASDFKVSPYRKAHRPIRFTKELQSISGQVRLVIGKRQATGKPSSKASRLEDGMDPAWERSVAAVAIALRATPAGCEGGAPPPKRGKRGVIQNNTVSMFPRTILLDAESRKEREERAQLLAVIRDKLKSCGIEGAPDDAYSVLRVEWPLDDCPIGATGPFRADKCYVVAQVHVQGPDCAVWVVDTIVGTSLEVVCLPGKDCAVTVCNQADFASGTVAVAVAIITAMASGYRGKKPLDYNVILPKEYQTPEATATFNAALVQFADLVKKSLDSDLQPKAREAGAAAVDGLTSPRMAKRPAPAETPESDWGGGPPAGVTTPRPAKIATQGVPAAPTGMLSPQVAVTPFGLGTPQSITETVAQKAAAVAAMNPVFAELLVDVMLPALVPSARSELLCHRHEWPASQFFAMVLQAYSPGLRATQGVLTALECWQIGLKPPA